MAGANVSLDQARTAKAELRRTLGKFVDVVGVRIAKRKCGYVLEVNVGRMPERQAVPSEVNGVPVVFVVVGAIRSGSLFGAHRGSVRVKRGVDLIESVLKEETDAESGREIDR
jgi:hypothetical protein